MSLAFTVRQLDAGPVISCQRIDVDDQIKVLKSFFFLRFMSYKLLILVSYESILFPKPLKIINVSSTTEKDLECMLYLN